MTRPSAFLPIIILVIGLLATLGITAQYWQTTYQFDQNRFHYNVEQKKTIIRNQISMYTVMLRGAAAAIEASDSFDHESFREYVRKIQLEEHYPGVVGIGYRKAITPQELSTIRERVDADPDFNLRFEEDEESPQDLIFVEPVTGELRPTDGFEFLENSNLRAAMARARDTGEPAVGAHISISSEVKTGDTGGFVIYVPVYSGKFDPASTAERRERLLGYVYSPVRAEDFFSTTFGKDEERRVSLSIYDAESKERELGGIEIGGRLPRFERTENLDVLGYRWFLTFRSLPRFEETFSVRLVPYVALTGFLVTIVFAAFLRTQVSARFRVEDLALRLEGERDNLTLEIDHRQAIEKEKSRLVAQKQRADELKLLMAEAGNELLSKLDYRATLSEVAKRMVPHFADWCAVDLLTDSGLIERLAAAHIDPSKVKLAYEISMRYPTYTSSLNTVAKVVKEGKEEFLPEIPDKLLEDTAEDEEHLQILKELGLCSAICMPLKSRGRVLGALVFIMSESGRRYTEEDLEITRELARLAATAIDNSMLYRAQQKREQEFRALSENSPDIIARFDVEGRHLYVNGAIRETGIMPEQLLGKTNREAGLDEALCSSWDQCISEVIKTGEEKTFEFKIETKKGTEYYHSYLVPETREGSAVVTVLGVTRNITERKEAENAKEAAKVSLEKYSEDLERLVTERTSELTESHERLRVSERMAALGTLSAGMGHDLGNLLLPVRMRLDRLEKKIPEELKEDLHAIKQSTEYLRKLVQSLKLLAVDSEAGGPTEVIQLSSWWSDVGALFKNCLPRKIELKHQFADSLPGIRIKQASLTQAIFNLVQNSGAAMKDRDGGRVEVFAEASNGSVNISVKDNGPGMTAEVKRRCQEPFFSTKTRDLSTGLGLSLVQGIVRGAGGRVEINSELNRGTTFILSFPEASDADGEEIERLATVSLEDKRLFSLVSGLLKASGFRVELADKPLPDSKLWIPAIGTRQSELRSYLEKTRDNLVLLFGSYGLDMNGVIEVDGYAPTKIRKALQEAALRYH